VTKPKEKPSLIAWFFYVSNTEKAVATEVLFVARKSPAGIRERKRDRGTKPLARVKRREKARGRG